MVDPRPEIAVDRSSYTYYPNSEPVPTNAAVKVLNRSHTITADVEIPKGGAEGVLLMHGGSDGGYSVYVKDGKLHYVHNYVSKTRYTVSSTASVPEGRHKLAYQFQVTGKPDIAHGKGTPGRGQLFIDGKQVGQADIPITSPLALGLSSGLVCGENPGSPVTPDYESPFKFTGTIYGVTVDVSGEHLRDPEAEHRAIMARQ
jgi:arylsulfatase